MIQINTARKTPLKRYWKEKENQTLIKRTEMLEERQEASLQPTQKLEEWKARMMESFNRIPLSNSIRLIMLINKIERIMMLLRLSI